MVRTREQGGRERQGDLYCLLPCRFVVLNQPQWDPWEASEWESEREKEKGEHKLSIWPGEDVNISFLAIQMSLVSIVWLFSLYFPRSLKPSTTYIISLPMSFQPSLISFSFLPLMTPSFDAPEKICLFYFLFSISSFPLSFHFRRSCLEPGVEYKVLETLIMFDHPVQKSTVNIRYWVLIWSCQLLPVGDL